MSIASEKTLRLAFAHLGLTIDATPSEVRAAWRALAPSVHPDLGHPHAGWLKAQEACITCLNFSRQPRVCKSCDGQGKTPRQVRGSFKVDWTQCSDCDGTGKTVLG